MSDDQTHFLLSFRPAFTTLARVCLMYRTHFLTRQLKKPVLSIFLLSQLTVLGFISTLLLKPELRFWFPNPVHQIPSTFSPDYFLKSFSICPQTLGSHKQALVISPLEYWYPDFTMQFISIAKISVIHDYPWAFIWHGTSFAEFTKPSHNLAPLVLYLPTAWHALCFVCVFAAQSCATCGNPMTVALTHLCAWNSFRQYASGVDCHFPPKDLPNPGLNPGAPEFQVILYHLS